MPTAIVVKRSKIRKLSEIQNLKQKGEKILKSIKVKWATAKVFFNVF
jgi:hypothetical protein